MTRAKASRALSPPHTVDPEPAAILLHKATVASLSLAQPARFSTIILCEAVRGAEGEWASRVRGEFDRTFRAKNQISASPDAADVASARSHAGPTVASPPHCRAGLPVSRVASPHLMRCAARAGPVSCLAVQRLNPAPSVPPPPPTSRRRCASHNDAYKAGRQKRVATA